MPPSRLSLPGPPGVGSSKHLDSFFVWGTICKPLSWNAHRSKWFSTSNGITDTQGILWLMLQHLSCMYEVRLWTWYLLMHTHICTHVHTRAHVHTHMHTMLCFPVSMPASLSTQHLSSPQPFVLHFHVLCSQLFRAQDMFSGVKDLGDDHVLPP